ncbi:MAG TPA: RagB/SusD family nutrient uptake outer membrane protein [Tangfeifania sp.]|nr:RagB/SusD family nutrient uptake outer membrane protein [Tangfeifania sp.]
MKLKKIIIASLAFVLFFTSCDEDFFDLNKEPQDVISNAAVFTDELLANANLAQIYHNTLFAYRDVDGPVADMLDEGMGAVARGFAYWQASAAFPLEVIDENGAGPIDYWPYQNIRNVNEFIIGMQGSEFDQDFIDQRVAEARYLRAHMYFQMVRRYGGVPILTEPQSVDTPPEELNVPRDSEQAVFDFIASELDEISNILAEETEDGRVNKYGALALKSRAMLYAASIAEFGTVQLDGLLGIPASQADNYWQASYNASLEIINSGKYALYNQLPDDPAENFQQLFVDESGNTERIFVEVYDPDRTKGHSFDLGAVPFEFRQTWGSNFCPFLNIVEEFEYADGTPGTIDRALIDSDHLFDIDEVFKNRDPRFLATIFFPESEWQGGVVRFHRRTVINGEEVSSGIVGDGWPAAAPRRNYVNTGFLVRKLMDEGHIGPLRGQSDTDFIIFRYGEILLNLAEAAFYLNKPGEALEKVNMIRERAGMPLRNAVTEDDIRHERTVELVFEDHRYWDLRRWRIAEDFLNGLRAKGLEYTYYYDEDKYDFHLKNGDRSERVFQDRHYYLPLGVGRLADNPNLVENPGY